MTNSFFQAKNTSGFLSLLKSFEQSQMPCAHQSNPTLDLVRNRLVDKPLRQAQGLCQGQGIIRNNKVAPTLPWVCDKTPLIPAQLRTPNLIVGQVAYTQVLGNLLFEVVDVFLKTERMVQSTEVLDLQERRRLSVRYEIT